MERNKILELAKKAGFELLDTGNDGIIIEDGTTGNALFEFVRLIEAAMGKEPDKLLDMLYHNAGPSGDWRKDADNPRWEETCICQNWRNHIPDLMKTWWDDLPISARVTAIIVASAAAGEEDWGENR